MRMSRMFVPTLKEVPADAEITSHQLMLRAGMIKKMSSGLYNQLPLGLRVFRKISDIILQVLILYSIFHWHLLRSFLL